MKKDYKERALLVGICLPGTKREEALDHLQELSELTTSAGAKVVRIVFQDLKKISPATLIGEGKMTQIAEMLKEDKIDLVIFDEELSASQNRNLESKLKIKVIDRTGLILDIFAQRARTKEGKLQVELAQSLYHLPRLVGQWSHFSRQTGGIGTRGPGETQLEIDRRRVRERINHIQKELQKVKVHRENHRHLRSAIPIPTISLVGYTNAGKSTLMKALTQSEVLVADQLFATLDPLVRRLKLPSGREVLLSDTVGFIRKLPHSLVDSFRATFEEIGAADLLLHVIDYSHPQHQEQRKRVLEVLKELHLEDKAILEVYNKIDLKGLGFNQTKEGEIYISAAKHTHLKELLLKLDELLSVNYVSLSLLIPYSDASTVSFLHQYCRILDKNI